MRELQTKRLRLIALTAPQLQLYLSHPARLQEELGFPISRSTITGRVRGAIEMKLAKMAQAEEETRAWYTYWLVVVADGPYGAGLAGFKGYPDGEAEAEIPRAISEAFRQGNLGIMDYYNLRNVQADTDMRKSIAQPGKEGKPGTGREQP